MQFIGKQRVEVVVSFPYIVCEFCLEHRGSIGELPMTSTANLEQ